MEIINTIMTKDQFLDKVKRKSGSDSSKTSAKTSLGHFYEFIDTKYKASLPDLVKEVSGNSAKACTVLNDFVIYLEDKKYHPKSIRSYTGFVKSFLRSQGVKTDPDDYKDMVSFPKIEDQDREPLTKDIIIKLLDKSKEKRKAIYLTLLSSAMRVGEMVQLKKRDFDFTKDPVLIKIPASYTKTKKSREVYISSEAKELVIRIVKKLKPDDLVFAKHKNPSSAVLNEERIFSLLRKRCGFTEKYENSNRFVINIHAFRAYTFTKARKVHDDGYAHRLCGHKGYLEQYDRLDQEERAEMYRAVEPNLLIYSTQPDEKELKGLRNEIDQLKEEQAQKLTEIDEIKLQLKTKENEGERNQTNMKTVIAEVVFLRSMVEEIAYNQNRKEDEANNVIPESKEKFNKEIEEYKKRLTEKLVKEMRIESKKI